MPFFTSPIDGAVLHYIDYTPATEPVPFAPATDKTKDLSNSNVTLVFIHGWPMSSQMYEHLTLKLCETHRIRCVASDRRGFGKSEWTGNNAKGNITYDTFAKDTAAWIESLNLESFVFIASSMGCGETLLAYQLMPEQVKQKCKGFIWMGPSMPHPIKTEDHPEGPSRELWDMILQGFRDDRVGFVKASMPGVFGTSFGIGIQLSEGVVAKFEQIVAQADAQAMERCVQIIVNKDLTPELKKLDERPKVLIIHGDSDQGMPASCSADLIGKLVKQAEVKIYEKAAHGMYLTHAEKVLEEIIAFVSGL